MHVNCNFMKVTNLVNNIGDHGLMLISEYSLIINSLQIHFIPHLLLMLAKSHRKEIYPELFMLLLPRCSISREFIQDSEVITVATVATATPANGRFCIICRKLRYNITFSPSIEDRFSARLAAVEVAIARPFRVSHLVLVYGFSGISIMYKTNVR